VIGAEGYHYRVMFYRLLTRSNRKTSGHVNMSADTRGLLASISALLLRIRALCKHYRYMKMYHWTNLSIALVFWHLCWTNEGMILALWSSDVDKRIPKFLEGNLLVMSFSPPKITLHLVWERNGAFAVRTRLSVWDIVRPLAIFCILLI